MRARADLARLSYLGSARYGCERINHRLSTDFDLFIDERRLAVNDRHSFLHQRLVCFMSNHSRGCLELHQIVHAHPFLAAGKLAVCPDGSDRLVVGRLSAAGRRTRLSEPLDALRRGGERAWRSVGGGRSFPITGYDDLTAAQVQERLKGLTPADLRTVGEYERRHANRKSVLAAIDKSLG